ncbi:hypothetical protein [Nostoc sp.]
MTFQTTSYEKEQEVHLASVDFRCAIAETYEDVTLAENSNKN